MSEIEALRAENERLRAELDDLRDPWFQVLLVPMGPRLLRVIRKSKRRIEVSDVEVPDVGLSVTFEGSSDGAVVKRSLGNRRTQSTAGQASALEILSTYREGPRGRELMFAWHWFDMECGIVEGVVFTATNIPKPTFAPLGVSNA